MLVKVDDYYLFSDEVKTQALFHGVRKNLDDWSHIPVESSCFSFSISEPQFPRDYGALVAELQQWFARTVEDCKSCVEIATVGTHLCKTEVTTLIVGKSTKEALLCSYHNLSLQVGKAAVYVTDLMNKNGDKSKFSFVNESDLVIPVEKEIKVPYNVRDTDDQDDIDKEVSWNAKDSLTLAESIVKCLEHKVIPLELFWKLQSSLSDGYRTLGEYQPIECAYRAQQNFWGVHGLKIVPKSECVLIVFVLLFVSE